MVSMKHPGNQRFKTSLRTAVAIAVVATSALTALPAGAAKGGKTTTSSESSVSLDCATTAGYSDKGTTGSMYNVSRMIGADLAWARGFTGAGIDVALIDTGTVPVTGLGNGKVIDGPDLSFDSPIPALRSRDTFGHGTHMAGIIAGNDVDRKWEELEAGEFQGVAPDARIVNVKVADSTGAVDVSQIIAGWSGTSWSGSSWS